MENMKLFVVYLGGKVAEGRMGEDHEVVVVVAPDASAAREKARSKWTGLGKPHVDATKELDAVDGYAITLTAGAQTEGAPVDPTWVP